MWLRAADVGGRRLDIVALTNEVTPYVTAAVAAYGAAVLRRAEDEAADASVDLGRRMLDRLRGTEAAEEEAEGEVTRAVQRLAVDPADPDLQAVLRVAIREVLGANTELAAELEQTIPPRSSGSTYNASGDRSVALDTNHGVISTGDIQA